MGGTTSTRRVVVEDAGTSGEIKISEAVVRRIKGQADKDPSIGDEQPKRPSHSHFQSHPEHMAKQQISSPEVDDFFKQKLKELDARNAALQQQTNEQFAIAVKEVEQKFVNYTASPVCQDLQSKVLACYQENPKEILNCSALVHAFTSCVDRARLAASSSRMQSVS